MSSSHSRSSETKEKKKGLWARLMEKLDQKLEEKAKGSSSCCGGGKGKGSSCC